MASVLAIPTTVSRGNADRSIVKIIQEWLNLREFKIKIDGLFGPATEEAVKAFQSSKRINADGKVDPATFTELVKPMSDALSPLAGISNINGEILDYAKKHLGARAREVGGNNMGPWVRLYMDGNEGPDWPWCAGFVSFCIKQAAAALNINAPVRKTFSCDVLGQWGMDNGTLVSGNASNIKNKIRPGNIFLVRKSADDWVHTGFVTDLSDEYCRTIEGNTNDEGSREGYEVAARIRGYGNLDFLVF